MPGPFLAAALLIAGCQGPQRMLQARGPAAERIADLWWVLFGLATFVCVVVIALLLFAAARGRARTRDDALPEMNGRAFVWAGGVIGPILILFPVLVYSYLVGRDVHPPLGADEAPLTIQVIGHQFWWEVRYPDQGIVTANEIHIPVGTPVRFVVTAPDVIHSFWIPQLHGKVDMIPGRVHELWVTAEQAGEYRGQCAEFCGLSHALMAFWTVAQSSADFESWVAARTAPAPPAVTPEAELGRQVFVDASCADCHSVPGVPLPAEFGSAGPDLVGLSRRSTIAAGTLPNDAAALQRWIEAPEQVKPGARMPPTVLPEAEMRALITYLTSI